MATSSVEKIIDQIGELNAIELSELTKGIEERFDVKAAAPMAMAAPAAAAPAAAEEEKTEFDVVLSAVDAAKKLQVIKVVKNITGLGLKEAKELVESAPAPIKEGAPKEEAEDIKKQVTEAGGTVDLK